MQFDQMDGSLMTLLTYVHLIVHMLLQKQMMDYNYI